MKTFFTIKQLRIFLISLLFFAIFWLTIISTNSNKKNETLIFITGEASENLKDSLSSVLDQQTQKINLISILESDTYYYSLLNTQGLLVSDLLILPKSVLDENILDTAFMNITDDFLTAINMKNYDLNYYYYQENRIGIEIYNSETSYNPLKGYITFEESDTIYYLLINASSKNVGAFSPKPANSDSVLGIVEKILSLKNNE